MNDLRLWVSDRASLSIGIVFAINSIAFSNWFTRIPEVQQKLDLSEAQLGLVLLGMPLGSILIMPLTSWAIARYGAGRTTFWTTLVCCLAIVLPSLSWNMTSLSIALLLLGLGNGSMDVAMNAEVAEIETRRQVPIMSKTHACFSLGGFVGAAVGSLIVGLNISILIHLTSIALVLILLLLMCKDTLLQVSDSQSARGPLLAIPSKALLGLAAMIFCIELGEGAIADWSAVYLRNTLNAVPILVGAGFACFSLGMTIGRLYGDSLSQRWGGLTLIRFGTLLAASGLGLGLWSGEPFAAILGFGCVGLGYAAIVPLLYRAAALTPGMSPGSSIAAVASAGYLGFLCGPVMIGSVAEVVGLEGGLGIVAVLALVVYGLSTQVEIP